MSIYQRYFIRSLIFLMSFVICVVLFLESNFGFKYFFNVTNYFFLGLKVENISGNWRNFTLKKVNFSNSNLCMKAKSIHFVANLYSFFNINYFIKSINAKHVILILKKNHVIYPSSKINILNFLKQKFFFNYPIILNKITCDTVLIKTDYGDLLISDFFSKIKKKNNHIIFFSTHIRRINIFVSNILSDKSISYKTKNMLLDSLNTQKKFRIFNIFLKNIKNLCIFDIDINNLKCKNINFFIKNKIESIFLLELKACLHHDILKIKMLKLYCHNFKIESFGKIVLKNNGSLSFLLKNKIYIFGIKQKCLKILFKGLLNNKFLFVLKSNNILKFHIHGTVLYNLPYYPFKIQYRAQNILIPIKNNFLLKIKNLNIFLKGNIKYYIFSLKNVLNVNKSPFMSMTINGNGSINNIFIKKINYTFFHKNCINTVFNNIFQNIKMKKNMEKLQKDKYASQLHGNINISGKSYRDHYNFIVPKFHFTGYLMHRKISLLGSFNCLSDNLINSKGIYILIGKNQLFIQGIFSNILNIKSSFYIHNLQFFLPKLRGRLIGHAKVYGIHSSPLITSFFLGKQIIWKDLHLEQINISSKIYGYNNCLNYLSIDIKNLNILGLNINRLNINFKKQNFYFFANNKKSYMNVVSNNVKSSNRDYNVFLKKMYIKTNFVKWMIKKSINMYFISHKNHFFLNNQKYIKNNYFFSLILNTKKRIFKIFKTCCINFNSKLHINMYLKNNLLNNLYDYKVVLISKNTQLMKKIQNKNFIQNIDLLKINMFFKKDEFNIVWWIKNSFSKSGDSLISGFLKNKNINGISQLKGKCNIFNFPSVFMNIFIKKNKIISGFFTGHITINGSWSKLKIFTYFNILNLKLKSNELFQYVSLFFNSFFRIVKNITFNQIIFIKKASIFFILDLNCMNSIQEWNMYFNSKNMMISTFPYMYIKIFPNFHIHYLLSNYDLIGDIKFLFLHFYINKKNFSF